MLKILPHSNRARALLGSAGAILILLTAQWWWRSGIAQDFGWPRGQNSGKVFQVDDLGQMLLKPNSSIPRSTILVRGILLYGPFRFGATARNQWAMLDASFGSGSHMGFPVTLVPDPAIISMLRKVPILSSLLPPRQQPSSSPNMVGVYRVQIVTYSTDSQSRSFRLMLQNAILPDPFPPAYNVSV